MGENYSSIAGKSLWTMGTYAASACIRFSTNIVLSHLLGPAALGTMVVAQAVRAGAELLTDMGLEQNVVHSPRGNDTHFLNTIWTMQIIRGSVISIVCVCLANVFARFYRVQVLILVAMSAAPLLNSLTSTSIFTLSKHLNVKTRNLFEMVVEFIGLIINITLAFTLRNLWAPILGILLSLVVRSALSYLLPHPHHRLFMSKVHLSSIFHFSKWIILSSFALYAAVYIDRLFLARVVDLSILGVYGLAKAIADLPLTVSGRLAFQIVFPVIARNLGDSDTAAQADLARTRRQFILLVALGIGTVVPWSDWAVKILYGDRYSAAGWMLCLLLGGSWVGVLASLNEAALFGRGRPQIVSLANLLRISAMAIALPTGFSLFGLPGAISALPAGECVRYFALTVAQRRLQTAYLTQDVAATLVLLALSSAWLAIRLSIGLSTPWTLMP